MRIVQTRAPALEATRAVSFGFAAESSFDEIIRVHIEHKLGGSSERARDKIEATGPSRAGSGAPPSGSAVSPVPTQKGCASKQPTPTFPSGKGPLVRGPVLSLLMVITGAHCGLRWSGCTRARGALLTGVVTEAMRRVPVNPRRQCVP
jgi:hypothetical protein